MSTIEGRHLDGSRCNPADWELLVPLLFLAISWLVATMFCWVFLVRTKIDDVVDPGHSRLPPCFAAAIPELHHPARPGSRLTGGPPARARVKAGFGPVAQSGAAAIGSDQDVNVFSIFYASTWLMDREYNASELRPDAKFSGFQGLSTGPPALAASASPWQRFHRI
jgi:hypothetical protein